MAVIKSYHPGEFCWTDLGTKDVPGAKKFYQALFDWKIKEYPFGAEGEKYSFLRIKSKDACALYPMTAEEKKMKTPPFWLPFISVKSVNRTAKKAKTAGGKICVEPMDVKDNGRMAVIQDPTGAVFALWEADQHPGAGVNDTPGTVCWRDLNTSKPEVAAKFYKKVFGWKIEGQKFSDQDYHLFANGKDAVCGMWPEPMKKLPPSWLTYWQVADCEKTVAKAKKMGGRILMGMTEVPEMCRFAILKDPQGAPFGVLEPL